MANQNDYVLEMRHLFKCYKKKSLTIRDISLKIPRGSFFVLLGTNGAGKSTLINMLSSALSIDEGDILINGHSIKDNNDWKGKIGFVLQDTYLDGKLTVEENLFLRSSFYYLSKKERQENFQNVVKLLELEDILDSKFDQLSGGQKRKVDIARAIFHMPVVLVLDEVTTGLDAGIRQKVWEIIENIRKKTKITILCITHYLEEAENADYIAIIQKGQVIAQGTPDELKSRYVYNCLVVYSEPQAEFDKALKAQKERYRYDRTKKAYLIFYNHKKLDDLIATYHKYINKFENILTTVKDMFISATNLEVKNERFIREN